MEIHPLSRAHGVSTDDLRHAFEHGSASAHAGNGPTQVLVLGADTAGSFLEITCVILDEDVLVYHAAPMRPEYQAILDLFPSKDANDEAAMSGTYGLSADDLILTDAVINQLFQTADEGHDVSWLKVRTRPGRPAPLAMGPAVRVGLASDLHQLLSDRAKTEGIPIDEAARQSLRQLLRHATART